VRLSGRHEERDCADSPLSGQECCMNTRTIAILALVIAVVLLIIFLV
jgi:hypothetical protein